MLGWELPPHNSGGLGVACYHMSKALALAGASIDFVVPYSATHPETSYMKIHHATNMPPFDRYGSLGAYSASSALATSPTERTAMDIRSIQKRYVQFVRHLVKNTTPDAIHAHDWLTIEAGIAAKQITGSPLIVHVHATEFDRSGERYGNPIVHEIEYQGLLHADRIIAVSEITKKIIIDKYKVPADKIEVVYNAIDADMLTGYTYDQTTYRYLESLREEGVTVVATIGRLTIQKGLTHFLHAAARACAKYDKLAFVVAGDGEQRDELIALSARLGIADKVFFTGFVRGKQWRDIYSLADIFVMSSVSEPFGLTALEAAHHDTSLIITKQSGVGEVLSSIFRYDFWDTDTLADQMIGIATLPSLAGALRRGAKREYTRFNWNDVAQQCLSLYEKAGATRTEKVVA